MFSLPNLDFDYSALEPHIDTKTMEIHHTKHHQGYINNLNTALEKHPDLQKYSLEELLINISSLPAEVRQAIQNNAGGHYNHTLFWQLIKPSANNQLSSNLESELIKTFGSLDSFKEQFTNAALSRFGSGWAWLIKNQDNSLQIVSTPNQDTPITQTQKPILGLDVWEHAYYLNYQNRRLDYIQSFWNILNWSVVSDLYQA